MLIFDASSPLFFHRFDLRVRIIAVAVFATLLCLCSGFVAVAVSLCFALAITMASGISIPQVVRRMIAVNFFMLVLLVMLPLSTPGTPAFAWRFLSWSREGIFLAVIIALRANAIMLVCITLLGTARPVQLGAALGSLGFPEKLTQVFFFMVRYIEVVHREYHRLSEATRLRGFRPQCNRHTFRTYGYLVGMLLVRSIERTERILAAMKCRGFNGKFYILTPFRLHRADLGFALMAIFSMGIIGWMEWL